MITHYLQIIVSNPWFQLAAFLLTVLGLIWKSNEYKKAFYYSITGMNNIVNYSHQIDKLEIKYDGKPISNLYSTTMAIWNSGNVTINKNDIASLDPLRVSAKGENIILDVRMLFRYRDANQLNLAILNNNKDLIIKFDFLDKNDGGVFQILHTGNGFDDIIVSGIIKGIEKIYNIDTRFKTPRPDALAQVLSLGIGYIIFNFLHNTFYLEKNLSIIIAAFVGIFLLVLYMYGTYNVGARPGVLSYYHKYLKSQKK